MNSAQKQSIAILGATGSIGESALSVISQHPQKFSIFALCANENVEVMFALCKKYKPRYTVLADTDAASQLQDLLTHEKSATEVLGGSGAIDQIAGHLEVDIVIAAITGAAGLSSTMAAANAGKKILLANKESLVIAGHYLLEAVRINGAQLIPLDSEHNAIFQCHPVSQAGQTVGEADNSVSRILLTASGGPFLKRAFDTFDSISVAEACAHPRWKMGKKISIDSATMMNKGLELIEACLLFGVKPEQVQIVIHPQSVVHSMVEYADGSVLAQLGITDMRVPIAHALAYPSRITSGVKEFDIFEIAQLDFSAPCLEKFPALALAKMAARDGKVLPTIMNAANEVCVQAFINKQITFTQISEIVGRLMQDLGTEKVDSLSDIIELDKRARVATQALLN